MCRRWSTSWPRIPARALLALALLLAPLGAWRAVPAATIAICTAAGGVAQVPDPSAPPVPVHAHCDACLVAPPAMPAPAVALRPPVSGRLAWADAAAEQAPPLALPPEQARAPPAA